MDRERKKIFFGGIKWGGGINQGFTVILLARLGAATPAPNMEAKLRRAHPQASSKV